MASITACVAANDLCVCEKNETNSKNCAKYDGLYILFLTYIFIIHLDKL